MPEKRTKPCSSCKKAKVKCIYSSSLPCERCIRLGASLNCQYIAKLPSLSLPLLGGGEGSASGLLQLNHPRQEPFRPLPGMVATSHPTASHPSANIQAGSGSLPRPALQSYNSYETPEPSSNVWKSQMEIKMNSFDNKLNDLVDILKMNQKMMLDNQPRYDQLQQLQYLHPPQPQHHPYYSLPQSRSLPPLYASQSHPPQAGLPYVPTQYIQAHPAPYHDTSSGGQKRYSPERERESSSSSSPPESGSSNKKPKVLKLNETAQNLEHSDFRDTVLLKLEAVLLFNFFDENISQQLFGFELTKFDISEIWESSPILVCAICTISSIHHPSTELSSKQHSLKHYLHKLCGQLIFMGRPKNELEGFNTIVALILCSFWLTDSQMFTGLALQIAKEIGLNPSSPHFSNGTSRGGKDKNRISKKDKLKLWYLLYVLDGQQSLTFNRQPLVNSNDYSLTNVRGLLVGQMKRSISENETNDIGNNNQRSLVSTSDLPSSKPSSASLNNASASTAFTDLRLVSQVEYNQALNEVFNGNAWDLLAPSSFGIPSKSNLELDKWMVSWTVLLSPVTNGAVWSSKSTLIYYNFAKMHINSNALRNLQFDASEYASMLPKWDEAETKALSKIEPLEKVATPSRPSKDSKVPNGNDEDSEDSEDDEDEFISNKDLVSEDETILNATVAVNAASTVVNLVVNDNDILNNLKYVPIHIHIMLYYAALLLINPPLQSSNKSIKYSPQNYFEKLLANLKTVKRLQKKIYFNLPIDKSFGNRLIKSLEEALNEKCASMKKIILSHLELDNSVKIRLIEEIDKFIESEESKVGDNLQSDTDLGRSTSPAPEKIFAWPGSNHGHPSASTKNANF